MSFDVKEEHLIIKPYKSDSSVYVREQKGKFQKIRRYTGMLFILVFALIPFIQFNGKQAVLLDVANQQFHIFGVTLFPQDFTVLAWLFIVGAFILFFITTWLGRIWCGYLCPQTVWVFMYIWVEEKIEGTRNQRIKLDKSELSANKVGKKAIKHTIWLLMSFFTALTFMSYFVNTTELYGELVRFEWSGVVSFWVGLFTLCTYGNAGWLREKMCIYMCPYSRFQSAMFDRDTLLVAYDAKRGESRGRRKRKEDHKAKGLGDCVDCNLCVEVCPAGIDIRNGLQYECINCGACADACDQTMEKFNYPKGLISYTSENALEGNKAHVLRPKILGYGLISTIALCLMVFTMSIRVPLEVSVLRDRNVLYRVNYLDEVENSYRLNVTNKSQLEKQYVISVEGIKNIKSSVQDVVVVKAGEMLTVPLTLTSNRNDLDKSVTDLTLVIKAVDDDEVRLEKETRFYSD